MSVATDGQRLYVADTNNNRVLIWNRIPTTNYQPADMVLGQPDFDTWEEPTEATPSSIVCPWGVETDGQRLYVADTIESRVLIWNTIPTENNQPADVVVGQLDFESTEPGNGRTGFHSEPDGVFTDGKRLFVSDGGYNRVLIWNTIPTQNGQPADVVLGQLGFEYTNGGPELEPPVRIPLPIGIFSDGNHLFVAATGNARIMIWNNIPTQNGQPADVVLGQPNFEIFPGRASINRDGLFMPEYVVFDGQHLWVGETKFGDRVVRFSSPSLRRRF